MKKKITILEMGPMAEELVAKYGQYAPLFEELLADEDFEFKSLNIYADVPLPELHSADGYVFTGSKHGVYENFPWMLNTQEFIRQAANAKIPMIGICFGHQILAEALGGKVIKSPKGWGLGVQDYQVTPNPKIGDTPSQMRFNAIHQDQVIEKPKDAETFASSEFCEYAGLVYGGNDADEKPYALSLQAHPEFGKPFTTDLVNARRGTAFPEDLSAKAIASQAQNINNIEWGQVLVNFFKNNLKPRG